MESLDIERWRNLSELAAREQDPQKLQALVLELTKLLEQEIGARASSTVSGMRPEHRQLLSLLSPSSRQRQYSVYCIVHIPPFD
jgi:hypothetical protein